ncbi:MAG: transposase [Actinomycetota bacterium]|nr:transposase [Actinomycetota bacterium]
MRKLVLAMAAPEGRRRSLLGWSTYRRAHQAVAARCRAARRALARRGPSGGRAGLRATALTPEEARLTDEQWAVVRPLLPPQKGGVGRPPNDHRAVLGGILWVARTGSSWREMPEEYGDFTTAYKRWRLWKERGLWQRILEVLGHKDLPGPATRAVCKLSGPC